MNAAGTKGDGVAAWEATNGGVVAKKKVYKPRS